MFDHVFESGDGWVSPILVSVLPAPPPERIKSPGARKVAVAVTQPNGYQLSNAGVVLAWARTRCADWAMLFAWTGSRRINGERQASARWSWCWVGRREMYVLEPVEIPNPWGMLWYGHHDELLEGAIAEAVASLPEPMRVAAVVPVPRAKMLRLDSLNPFIEFTPRVFQRKADSRRGPDTQLAKDEPPDY